MSRLHSETIASEILDANILDITYDPERRSAASDLVLRALDPSLLGRDLDTFTGSSSHQVFGAFAGERVIGAMSISLFRKDKHGVIDKLATEKRYRGGGIATRLLRVAEQRALAVGVPLLEVLSSRPAISYYESQGFFVPDVKSPQKLVKHLDYEGIN